MECNCRKVNSIWKVHRGLLLAGLMGWLMQMGMAQGTSLNGRLIDFETSPSLIHVKEVTYPGLQLATWRNEILVDESGNFSWDIGELKSTALFELVAPPWSWMVMVRPDEKAELHLAPGRRVPQRLWGSPGISSWLGMHPTASLDSLMGFLSRANDLRAESLVLRTSGVGLQGRDSLNALIANLDSTFQRGWEASIQQAEESMERDLLWQMKLIAATNAGRSKRTLDSLWNESPFAASERSWESLLKSPGGFGSWQLVFGDWWQDDEVDWSKINDAIFLADRDSLAVSMGPSWKNASASMLAAAWLDKALQAPDAYTKLVWETIPFPKPFFEAYEALIVDRQVGCSGSMVGDIPWTLPNGELGSIKEQCRQPWTVVLLVKNGSATARREREMFNQIAESMDRRDVCWVVLSLDVNETEWRETLSGRRTLDETVGWVGNSPRVMEQLGAVVVPQVVVLDEEGKLSGRDIPLPSLGLESRLVKMLPKD